MRATVRQGAAAAPSERCGGSAEGALEAGRARRAGADYAADRHRATGAEAAPGAVADGRSGRRRLKTYSASASRNRASRRDPRPRRNRSGQRARALRGRHTGAAHPHRRATAAAGVEVVALQRREGRPHPFHTNRRSGRATAVRQAGPHRPDQRRARRLAPGRHERTGSPSRDHRAGPLRGIASGITLIGRARGSNGEGKHLFTDAERR